MGLKCGISKCELFEDYYIDEIGGILSARIALECGGDKDEEAEEVGADDFFA